MVRRLLGDRVGAAACRAHDRARGGPRQARYACPVPEGDVLHRAARSLAPLLGERLEVEARHPRAVATGVAARLDGRRLVGVEAVGKSLLLRFEGEVVLRSHLRMRGSWRVLPREAPVAGQPWLLLRGRERQAVLRHGPVLELSARALGRLGPDLLAEPLDLEAIVARLRAAPGRRELGDALLDQRLVAGIGNIWRAEALWEARLSPWRPLGSLSDAELRGVLAAAARLMRASVEGAAARRVYRRAGRPCPRCGGPIRAQGQGEANRTAYWCPGCQRGEGPESA